MSSNNLPSKGHVSIIVKARFLISKILHQYPFLKFLLVGGLNTAFGYMCFAVIFYFVEHPYLSLVLATIVAILFNFRTYGRIIFKSKDNSRIVRFFALYLSLMVLQLGVMKLLKSIGIEDTYVAGAIMTLPMAALSFTLMRKFVFHQHIIPDNEDLFSEGQSESSSPVNRDLEPEGK